MFFATFRSSCVIADDAGQYPILPPAEAEGIPYYDWNEEARTLEEKSYDSATVVEDAATATRAGVAAILQQFAKLVKQ